MVKRLILASLFVFTSANADYFVFSKVKTGYPGEKKIRDYGYLLESFDDYDKAVYLVEDIKNRKNIDVYVANSSYEDFIKMLDRSFMLKCIQKAKSYTYPIDFDSALFLKDISKLEEEIKTYPAWKEQFCQKKSRKRKTYRCESTGRYKLVDLNITAECEAKERSVEFLEYFLKVLEGIQEKDWETVNTIKTGLRQYLRR